jgi:hypothetical protein
MTDVAFSIASSSEKCRRTNPKMQALFLRLRRWLVKGKIVTALVLILAISIVSFPLFAHHGNTAYDMGKSVTLKGTVTQYVWANPHCILLFEVTDDRGQVVPWSAETENPSSMVHYGWTKESMKPGDQVTVIVVPAKNGKPIGRIVEVVLPNGQKLAGRGIQGPTKADDYPKQ